MITLPISATDRAVGMMRRGGTVVFPTETSYGLGCDATNTGAVEKIFAIKERAASKSVLIVVDSISRARQYIKWNSAIDMIAAHYWPGAVTVVGEYKKPFWKKLSPFTVAANGTVAVRVTTHPLLVKMVKALGRPIVATSANPSGAGDVYSAASALATFVARDPSPDMILDGGDLIVRPPTTIVSVVGNEIKILRQGEVVINCSH